jgi:hypothetical protein
MGMYHVLEALSGSPYVFEFHDRFSQFQSEFIDFIERYLKIMKWTNKEENKFDIDVAKLYYQVGCLHKDRGDVKNSQKNFAEAILIYNEIGAFEIAEAVRELMEMESGE